MAHVVLAPDSFKGSIAAPAAVAALADGWRRVRPADTLEPVPMADGGEGTLDVLAAVVAGAERRPVRVAGPDGRPVDTAWLLLPDGTAVVELAGTSGLPLLAAPAPEDAQTTGFGQAIAAALDAGATALLLGIGGSASTDGGAGMLAALGARLTDARGEPIRPGSAGLAAVDRVELAGLRPLPPGGAVVLSDVTVPLTGPSGAAALFGPQKGASASQVPAMDAALARLAALAGGDPRAPGAGAAGGTGYALALWGARVEHGATGVASRVGLLGALERADLVVTGEGRFDATSLLGKVVGTVRDAADAAGTPVALAAGSIDAPVEGFAAAVALTHLAGSAAAAMADPTGALRAAGAALARGLEG